MDMLEQYLDQVCRRIAGARDMRQHVRQELREHLLDAAVAHEAGGLSKEQALAKAIEDFGGPREVRDGLEDAHGARVSAIVLEKAMQWKEMTMKAKWLWTTWAHLALAIVISLEVLFICGSVVFLIPRFTYLAAYVWRGGTSMGEASEFLDWSLGYLDGVVWWTQNWWLPAVIVAMLWVIFEWRVRSENKTLMRLGGMSALAVGLTAALLTMVVAMTMPPLMSGPTLRLEPQEHLALVKQRLDNAASTMEAAASIGDWAELEKQSREISYAAETLYSTWLFQPPLSDEQLKRRSEMFRIVHHVSVALAHVRTGAQSHDGKQVEQGITDYRAAYDRLRALLSVLTNQAHDMEQPTAATSSYPPVR